MALTEISPRTVKTKQGFEVVLEKQGFTRDAGNGWTVTMFYGKRPNGKKIQAVPVFTRNGVEVIGKATGCF